MYNLIEKYLDSLLTKSTPMRPLWNIESLDNGKVPKWNYIDGCMITALLELFKITEDKKYFEFADEFIDYYIFEDGSICGYNVEEFNIDNINEGRVLFDLYELTKKEKYLKAIKLIYTQVLNHPRTIEGNFWHKKIYPHQVWLDGIYMAQPFYLMYENKYNDFQNLSDIINQIQMVRNLMFDENIKLYYHGYDSSKAVFWADKKTGLSQNFWLRSNGWFLVALIDILALLKNKKNREYQIVKDIFIEAINGIIRFQDSSGLWYQLVNLIDNDKNYLETSGSAMCAYAILKGVRIGILDKSYLNFGQNAFNGICNIYLKEKNEDLNLGGICLVAGLGPDNNLRRDGSIEYYLSEPIVENDAKGVGPFLLAYTEIKRQL